MKKDDLKLVVMKYGESVFGENNIFKGNRQKRCFSADFLCVLSDTNTKPIDFG